MERGGSRDPLIGTPVLGGYVITGLLGAGGMGSVYVAEHQRINKKVAVKVLHSHMIANRDIVERFLAEARAASSLDHPNIIEVVDAATLEDGRDYIALEFLDGEALDDFLRARGKLDAPTALRILAQACCGLEAAHHRGIIHRDLKPANLFIAPTELEPLRVKVLDFGIAKLNDTVLAGGISTQTNAVAGTPGYMPPEQARGMRNVDHRADIYSLGAVAYRMMTGALPYDGESLGEIIYQQLSSPPLNVRQHRPDLDVGWIDTIMSSLGADPNMRPPSARDVALRLAAATPGGDEIVRQVSPLFFSPIWIERNRALVEPLAVTEPPAKAPPGGTATYEPQTAPESPGARPVTTLSSAAGLVATPATGPVPRRRPWMIAGAIAAVAAAATMIALAVSFSGGDPSTAAAPEPDAAVGADAAPTIATATPDAAPIAADAAPAAPAARVVIEIELDPADAVFELDGTLTSARRLELARGSKHTVVVRRRGYRTQEQTLIADTSRSLRIELRRRDRREKTTKTEKTGPKGPISTDLGSDPVPVGPTTDEL